MPVAEVAWQDFGAEGGLFRRLREACAGDWAAYARANTAFHGAIYAGAHNSVLSDFASGLRRRLQPYREAQFRLQGRLARSHAEHGAVVAAVLAGQAAEAHAAMLRHVTLVESSVEGLLAGEGGAAEAEAEADAASPELSPPGVTVRECLLPE